MTSWELIGEIANVAQLTGLDATRLIAMTVRAASAAKMHKKNCRRFANHLKLIGNLLEQLKMSELKKFPETREPLEQFEVALRRAHVLVNSCRDRSYLHLLAMGWNIVYQFRKAQNEIDMYLKLIPLIDLVDKTRVTERLEIIEKDQQEYTLDEEDMRVQEVILRQDYPSLDDSVVLRKTISCSYPNMPFNEAVQTENEKLHLELQLSQANLDVHQCEFIQHLLDVTETVAAYPLSPAKQPKMEADEENQIQSYENSIYEQEQWHFRLLGCCSEPLLCMKTLFFPCGTFSRIGTIANNRHMSLAEAFNELMAYFLVLSCCCYTFRVRTKLRKKLNIKGGMVYDFISHAMCCCCALVQEWRELEIRGIDGTDKTKTTPPTSQFMQQY